jgi:glutathione S-transferase
MSDLKKPAFEKINANGRVPAIEDPNTGITLWASGAIIKYLQETYDKNNALTKQFPQRTSSNGSIFRCLDKAHTLGELRGSPSSTQRN